MKNDCNKCTSDLKLNQGQKASFLSTLLIVVIPKCPLCVMAYSSAITMCGGKDIYLAQNNWLSYLPIALSALIVILLAKRFKGTRTWVAGAFALLGLAIIVGVHQVVLPVSAYNVGAGILVIAIWVNGSFLSFVAYVRSFIRSKGIQWQS